MAHIEFKENNDVQFFIAAEMGDLDKLKTLYNAVTSVDCKWKFKDDPYNGWGTPLMYASRSGHFEVVQYLIKTCKSDINALDCESWTALHYASINNHVDIVSYLLQNGAKTDIIAVYEKCNAEGFAKYRRFSETVHVFDEFFNRKPQTQIVPYDDKEQSNICKRQNDKLKRCVVLDTCNTFKECKYINRYILDQKIYDTISDNISKVTHHHDVVFGAIDIVFTLAKVAVDDNTDGIAVWIRMCREFKRYKSIIKCLKENNVSVHRSNSLSGIHHIIVIPRSGDDMETDNGLKILSGSNDAHDIKVDVVYTMNESKDDEFEERKSDTFDYCDMYTLYNELQFSNARISTVNWHRKGKVFVDIRPYDEFAKLKIYQFVNIPFDICSDNNNENENENESGDTKLIQIIDDIGSTHYVIANQSISKNNKDIEFCTYLQEKTLFNIYNKVIPIVIVNTDVVHFANKFPFLCYVNDGDRKFTTTYPNHIVNDELFLGNIGHSANKKIMENLNITHIINMTMQNNAFENDADLNIKYLKIAIEDDENAEIEKYFDKGIDFMHRNITLLYLI